MLIRKLPKDFDPTEIEAMAAACCCRAEWTIVNICAMRITLKYDRSLDPGETTRRRCASGRRTSGVNWQVHKDFFTRLFDRYPACTVVTALATYYGQGDYLEKYGQTWHHNAGSRMAPAPFGSL